MFRFVVVLIDPGKSLDAAGARLPVQALDVALLAHVEGRVDEHLKEGQIRVAVDLTGHVSVLGEGRHEAAQRHDPAVGEQARHLGHAPDVLLAVLLGEAQVLVQPRADVVAVEPVRHDAPAHQVRLQLERHGRLARAGEPSEPDGASSEAAEVAEHLTTLVSRHMVLLLRDVGRHLQTRFQFLDNFSARHDGAIVQILPDLTKFLG